MSVATQMDEDQGGVRAGGGPEGAAVKQNNGFAFALLCLGAVREVLGNGSLFGVQLFHDTFQDWVAMILPGGGFFTLAGWLLLFNHFARRREAAASAATEAEGAA